MFVQSCYNPIEIKSKPPRRFLAKMKKPCGRAFFEEPFQWRLPMTAPKP
jgi:hypothetical protein